MKKLFLFLFGAASMAACSTTQSTVMTKRPMVASMEPMAPAPTTVEVKEDLEQSASAFLERAFMSFRQSDFSDASRSFDNAIATNNLNDSGRVLAYWHIYLCEAQLEDEDAAADALMSFSVVATDMLDESSLFAPDYLASRDFAERFDLEGRLARARAILSAMWVDRSADYGRTDVLPIRVHSPEELSAFLELAPPCTDAARRQVDRKVIATDGETAIEEVTLYCDAEIDGARFVIEHAAR